VGVVEVDGRGELAGGVAEVKDRVGLEGGVAVVESLVEVCGGVVDRLHFERRKIGVEGPVERVDEASQGLRVACKAP
jgi:hypothetical protein